MTAASTVSIVVVLVVAAECSGDGENKRGNHPCANIHMWSHVPGCKLNLPARKYRVASNPYRFTEAKGSKPLQAVCNVATTLQAPLARFCNLLKCTSDQQVPLNVLVHSDLNQAMAQSFISFPP